MACQSCECLQLHSHPRARSVALQDLCALLVKGLWMVNLEVDISSQTDDHTRESLEQTES